MTRYSGGIAALESRMRRGFARQFARRRRPAAAHAASTEAATRQIPRTRLASPARLRTSRRAARRRPIARYADDRSADRVEKSAGRS